MSHELAPTFVAACREVGSTAGAAEMSIATTDLVARWNGDDRGYHDLEHLAEVLDRLAELGAASGPAVLGAWFHDAVYTGRAGDDERASADLAVAVLTGLAAPGAVARRVADLVLVTADHRPAEGDAEAAALCDADLAVLAAAPDRYARYVAGVRHEHRHVPDLVFAAGRAAVLRDLAQRPVLFRTPRARLLWEAAARHNLATELAGLTPPG